MSNTKNLTIRRGDMEGKIVELVTLSPDSCDIIGVQSMDGEFGIVLRFRIDNEVVGGIGYALKEETAKVLADSVYNVILELDKRKPKPKKEKTKK